jgi:predicted ATPase
VVTARASRAAVLWLLGFPEQALEAAEDAVRLGERLAHPFSLAVALHLNAMVHQFRREGAATQAGAEALVRLSTEQNLAFWAGAGMISRGWAWAAQGAPHDAVTEIRRGLAIERSTGTELSQPHGITLLAETCLRRGLIDEGLDSLAQALDAVERSEERMYEAEIHRLRAEVLVKQGRVDEAATSLQRALGVARGQQARSLELRAAMSLGRLWERAGRREDARRLLAETHGWFREGFDTADLQEARALLEAWV